ncbi:MAG TPA: cytochrome c, partial [Terriglobia bacterium]|nr:cytochrome c [Terriglobia bacterium]
MKLQRLTLLGALGLGCLAFWSFRGIHAASPAPQNSPAPSRTVTFARDIAPIVYSNCALCHHPGGPGPFSVLTYADVRARAAQIATVTQSRYMPPWLPKPGYGDFQGERRLTDDQIQTIQEWVKEGAPQGDLASAPPAP